MSLWDIHGIRCNGCDEFVSCFDYDLEPHEQQEFLDALTRDGWHIPWAADEIESDDDCMIYSRCKDCKGQGEQCKK